MYKNHIYGLHFYFIFQSSMFSDGEAEVQKTSSALVSQMDQLCEDLKKKRCHHAGKTAL